MKRALKLTLLFLIPILGIALIFPQSCCAKKKWYSVKPDGVPAYLRFGKESKALRYYRVSDVEVVKLTVYGPTTLKVWSRLGLKENDKGDYYYTIEIKRDGEVDSEFVTKTSMSSLRFLSPTVLPGKKRSFQIRVPKGKHVYEFRLVDTAGRNAYLRFYKTKEKARVSRVLLQPREFKDVINTVVSEKLSKYYVADEDNPLELDIIGPTTIKGYSRVNFNSKMKGKIKYSFDIYEDGKLITTESASSSKSDYYYKNNPKLVPSIADIFRFRVPAGKHTYRIEVKNGAPAGISFRLLIPKRDLDN